MIKRSSPETLFTQRVLSNLSSLRRPTGQVHNLLQNTLNNRTGNGFFTIQDKPIMATFIDPKTRSNFGVEPDFNTLDLAKKLRETRNRFRVTNPLQNEIKQKMLG